MKTNVFNVRVNRKQEMRSFINKIKSFGLKTNGIIFGGLVRDEIIASHYRQLFIDKELDYKKYWNPHYDPDTNKRIIIPNDMDIYFKNEHNIEIFINYITEFINLFNGYITINKMVNSTSLNGFKYINENIKLQHTKINLGIVIGKTINYQGITLKFSIDVIYPDNSNIIDNYKHSQFITNTEPPFFNLDFTSNIFIMENIGNNYNIRLSTCTGTLIDNMPFSYKNKLIAKITDDIINLRTQFVRNVYDSFNAEFVNTYRILKMIDRDNIWNITNIPFKIIQNPKDLTTDIDNSCCICLEDIKIKKDKFTKIVIVRNSTIFHYPCFINYLNQERSKRYVNPDTNLIECRCPLRIPFNFKDCYKEISYYL